MNDTLEIIDMTRVKPNHLGLPTSRVQFMLNGTYRADAICGEFKPKSKADNTCKHVPLDCKNREDVLKLLRSVAPAKPDNVVCVRVEKLGDEENEMATTHVCDICKHKGKVVETNKRVGFTNNRRKLPTIDVCPEHSPGVKALTGPEFVQLAYILKGKGEISLEHAEEIIKEVNNGGNGK